MLHQLSDTDQSDLKSREIPDQQKNSQVTVKAHTEKRGTECPTQTLETKHIIHPFCTCIFFHLNIVHNKQCTIRRFIGCLYVFTTSAVKIRALMQEINFFQFNNYNL